MIKESEVRILKGLSKYLAKFVAVILSFSTIACGASACDVAVNRNIGPITRKRAASCDREKTKMMRLKIYWVRLITTRDYYYEVKKLYPSESEANKFLTKLIKCLDRIISRELGGKRYCIPRESTPLYISGNISDVIYDIVYRPMNVRVNYANLIDWDSFPGFTKAYANVEPRVYLGKASNGKHYCFMYDYRSELFGGLKLCYFEKDGDMITITEE